MKTLRPFFKQIKEHEYKTRSYMEQTKRARHGLQAQCLPCPHRYACITPVLALISGVGGIAATFSWLEPVRPYLIGITTLVLGFAWYQELEAP
ncbi:MAG: hypothetical protein U5K54_05000 [Cytophagales bacterium]|nr:hypothetical protein [Cytophagales bacterium]